MVEEAMYDIEEEDDDDDSDNTNEAKWNRNH